MGTVQYFMAVLLSAQLVLNSPMRLKRNADGRKCIECPAGEFLDTCNKCKPCLYGSYTERPNQENSCHPCFRDCLPSYHLKEAQSCTSTTPLKCECEPGFKCTGREPKGNCNQCEKDNPPPAVTVGKPRQPTSPQDKPCSSSRCGPPATAPTNPRPGYTSAELAAILGPVVFIGCMALMIMFCIYQPRDETCFRQIIAKLCNEEGQSGSRKAKESTHQFPGDSVKQQTSPLSDASLGPVQVHNPGTVIFSLLSHFTGPVGPTELNGKRAERASHEEEDERDCPVFHPTPSPSIHLSKEEGGGETEDVFFPSQEQGKDFHVSKEEAL
ncbi:PREDICTED: uncharacterized protein LOC106921373 [Poecilia mexicana]|uniref:uncharacterized protein LOC106921373 n=1 Tax=Poecilia mexicana TaxID=48701 RepID=UPI00072DE50D|nr:PREDICTED: uncharacterized protein LOC106921373 [Poecilia mexicana]XP_014848526.1 PREDICTED: uncharacterized protein LOC106921373 [Poecilia mexicana]